MKDATLNRANYGFIERSEPTRNGGVVTIEGILNTDFKLQERLLLNGVALNLKLFQASDSFMLQTSKAKNK